MEDGATGEVTTALLVEQGTIISKSLIENPRKMAGRERRVQKERKTHQTQHDKI
jgi:hypothetical protein